MSEAVLISIKPEWCELIASGKKTIEVRKTKPKLTPPFTCYIYCSIGDRSNAGDDFWLHPHDPERKPVQGNGRVIGEFVCDRVAPMKDPAVGLADVVDCEMSCLTAKALIEYSGGKMLYGWHISNLRLYDRPKYFRDFIKPCRNDLYCEICAMYNEFSDRCGNAALVLKHPPQSWCYVEEFVGGAEQ